VLLGSRSAVQLAGSMVGEMGVLKAVEWAEKKMVYH
jgi:hypothetical protein